MAGGDGRAGAGKALARDGLNPRQRRFALEYLLDLNATDAAKRAGYSPRTAYQQGSALLKHPEVRKLIGGKLEKLEERTFLKVERLEQELERLCLFDPLELLDDKGALRPVSEWPENARRALVSYEEEAFWEGPPGSDGKERFEAGKVKKVKWHDKRAAIELALRRRGALKDVSEVQGAGGGPLTIIVKRKGDPA